LLFVLNAVCLAEK